MYFIMYLGRLAKDGLIYELTILCTTRDSSLASSFVMSAYPFAFTQDSVALAAKLPALRAAVSPFADSRPSRTFNKSSIFNAQTLNRTNLAIFETYCSRKDFLRLLDLVY